MHKRQVIDLSVWQHSTYQCGLVNHDVVEKISTTSVSSQVKKIRQFILLNSAKKSTARV